MVPVDLAEHDVTSKDHHLRSGLPLSEIANDVPASFMHNEPISRCWSKFRP